MRSSLLILLGAVVAALGMSSGSRAQTNYFFRTPASEINGFTLPAPPGPDGNWFDDDNWFDPTLQNRFMPEFDFGDGERAFIENGGTALVTDVIPTDRAAGQIVMGSASGTAGTLEIQDGASLASRRGAETNGSITVGSSGGMGTLRVMPGGTLTAEGAISQGTNSANLVRVGGLSGGTATLSANSAVLPAQVQVFPNADFSVAAGANFFATSTYAPEITGNGVNGTIDVGGTATLGGSLMLNFNGYTPSVGHNWNVLQAATFNGNFGSVSSNASLASNESFVVTRPDVGGGRKALNVRVEEVLVLEVDRNTGMATIKHPGTSSIPLDGYFVGSGVGSLDGAGWTSFQDQGLLGGDWVETAPTATNIGELKPTGDATIPGGNVTNISLGSIFDAHAGDFGQMNEDLQFTYRRSSDGVQINGVVQYSGTKVNTLLLQVDPSGAGDAYLRNTSDTTVMIDGYDVLSADGSLTTSGWNSLDEQDAEGADTWLEVDSNANQIGEVNQVGFTPLAPGASLNLGPLFNGGTQDLDFSFLLMGEEVGTPGIVLYEAFSSVALDGDYNGDNVVDAADYTVWRDNLGAMVTLPNDTTPGSVTSADYTVWKANFGMTSGAGSVAGAVSPSPVPEPATWALAALAGLLLAWRTRKNFN